MNPLFDIFEKKEKSAPIKKPEVVVDIQEKNSLVASELKSLGISPHFRHLKVADYLVGGVAIERKTVSDFLSSMISKRLLRQLEELQQYEKKLLIIEGIEEQELYNEHQIRGIHANSIRGFLLSILLRHNIPILFTKNYADTAKFLSIIAKKKKNEISDRAHKKSRDYREQLQYILEGFPGVGPKTSRKLLEKFKTLRRFVNASEKDLKKILGKKAGKIKELMEKEVRYPHR